MQEEVEVKFLNTDHDHIRRQLKDLGATLVQPMRLMRRMMFDYADHSIQKRHARLRVRDEGDVITMAYKARGDKQYDNEIETVVASFDAACGILKAAGLEDYSYQESKRETWRLGDIEIVLDEWPWLPPYIEIEGHDEAAIQECASKLGFNWDEQAVFGSVDSAYIHHYPKMKLSDSVGEIARITFDGELPDWLKERQA